MGKKRFSLFNIFLSIVIIQFAIFNLLSCHHSENEAEKPRYAGLSDSVKYVGINTCEQCHPDIYKTFIETGMGKSFDVATRAKSSARFDQHAIIYDKFRNLHYQPFWENDSMYIREFRLEGRDTSYRRIEKVNYIIGSGQHTNSHMMNINGYVYQMPATFYTQKGTWDLPPGFENGYNSRFSRKIELECMSCHNAYPSIVKGSENKYDFIPTGIDCERCHGPGSEHVKQKQNGQTVDISKEIDYSIVNPAKLPVALQLDICQRCHIQGNAVLNEGKSFFDFRPGMHLSDVMNVFMPVFKGDDESHIMASHAERLKMSKCFISSLAKADEKSSAHDSLFPYRNAMTCVTCHNPHVSVKQTGSDVFNNACKNCHHSSNSPTQTSTSMCTDSYEHREKVNDNCVLCHMPRNNTIDIPHVITTDHYIRKPVDKVSANKIKEFVGLACINNPSPSRKATANAYLSYFEKFNSSSSSLDSAKNYLPDISDEDVKSNFSELVRWAYLKNDFAKVVHYSEKAGDVLSRLNSMSYSNEDAWTAYRIGEANLALENTDRAINFFQRAVDLEPYNLEFINKLGSAQMDIGRHEDARKNFNFILKQTPEFASAWVNLGYVTLMTDHNVDLANSLYDKALALDPDNEQALFNKAGAMLYLTRNKEAKKLLERVMKMDPQNRKAKAILMSLSVTEK